MKLGPVLACCVLFLLLDSCLAAVLCPRGCYFNTVRNRREACPPGRFQDDKDARGTDHNTGCKPGHKEIEVHAEVDVRSGKGSIKVSGRGECKCFHGNSTVRLRGGRETTLERLRVGDEVLAVSSLQEPVYSPVLLLLHRDVIQEAEYVRIWTEGGKKPLTLTPKHLTFVLDAASGSWHSIFADDVTPGMQVGVVSPDTHVIRARRVERVSRLPLTSAYAPLTREGTIVVDDVMASCYAAHENHNEAHAAMAPIRAGYGLGAWLGLTNQEEESKLEGIHWSAKLMMKITCALRNERWC